MPLTGSFCTGRRSTARRPSLNASSFRPRAVLMRQASPDSACVAIFCFKLPTRGSREEYRHGYDKTRLALCVILTAPACYNVSGADLWMMWRKNPGRCAWPSFGVTMTNWSNCRRIRPVTPRLSDANDRYCRSHFPSCKKIAGLTRMERAKPVNWSEVESCFARIIQTAFQCSWRKWWRLDSHQRRRSGPCQYQWSCRRWWAVSLR